MGYRAKILKIVYPILFLAVLARLGYLQLNLGKKYLIQAEENHLRVIDVDPARGFIFDRKGRLLVANDPSYSIVSEPQNLLKNPAAVTELRRIFNESSQSNWENQARKNINRAGELKLRRDVDFATLAAVESNRLFLPGIDVKIESKRSYPYKTAIHILGYLGEINQNELQAYGNFQPGDIVGKRGIERTYNSLLFGQKGYKAVVVDASGNRLSDTKGVKAVEPMNGNDIYLTIDLDLQILAEDLLTGESGAVVAMDPNTGEILAMASAPDYNPEFFSGVLKQENWESLLNNPKKPLLNRCIQGTYPPGSVIKMAILAAGLEEKVISPETRVTCHGFMQFGNRPFKCWKWKDGGHGSVNALQAIEQSCDVYFYQLGIKLGITRISKYLKKFGFGSITSSDIEGELKALVPDSSYMDKRYGVRGWTKGQLMNIAIGQGDLLVTPLQLAVYCATLANRGKMPTAHLFKGVLYHNPDKWEGYSPALKPVEGISQSTYDILLQGMYEVVQGSRGTAHWLMDKEIQVAGKTGTAQNPHGDDHAWFIGYAPIDKPQIVVCALVEFGEHGSSAAAPIVMKLIKQYLVISNPKALPLSAKAVG